MGVWLRGGAAEEAAWLGAGKWEEPSKHEVSWLPGGLSISTGEFPINASKRLHKRILLVWLEIEQR